MKKTKNSQHNQLIHEMLRSIWRTRTRFLSILGIVAIGCGFFAGVKSSCPDMKLTADQYFSDNRLMDLHLISTFGFNDDDLAAIQSVDGIRGMMKGYSTDTFLEAGESSNTIVKVYSLPKDQSPANEDYINRPILKEGRFPEQPNECVVEKNMHTSMALALGNTIRLLPEAGDDSFSDTLKNDEYTIVGIVEAPMYIGYNRGHTSIGDGDIDAFMMVPEENFVLDVYTDVYLTLNSTKGLSAFEDAYPDAVDERAEAFEKIAAIRGEERYTEIYEEAQKEINDAKEKLNEGEETQQKELTDAQAKITDAQKELDDGQKTYESELRRFNQEIDKAEDQLASGEVQLADGEKAYDEGLAQYENGLKEYEAKEPEALGQIAQYEAQEKELSAQVVPALSAVASARSGLSGVQGILTQFEETSLPESAFPDELKQMLAASEGLGALLPEGTLPGGTSLSALLTRYVEAEGAGKALLRGQIDQIAEGIDQALTAKEEALAPGKAALEKLQEGIASAKAELAFAKATLAESGKKLAETRALLDENDAELEKGFKELAANKKNGREQLAQAKQKLIDGQAELDDAKEEFEKGKAESDKELSDARKKITDAEIELEDLKEPTWYVSNRNSSQDYSNYGDDAEKVDAVATVFPIFFILVAALVCLTTMTRMVEEQRTQIGTLKALGYSRGAIMVKYIAYSVSASFLGAVIGLGIGFKLFPVVIINAYKMLYNLPAPLTPIHWLFGGLCVLVSVVCMGVTAFCAAAASLREFPAQLMRPKAPKAGKRVLLERLTFLWKRLSFTHKVTVRNIFRYKRRVLMTVVGIGGCTALMLAGFGMRYAVSAIGDKQYGNVFVYDTLVALEEDLSLKRGQEVLTDAYAVPQVDASLLLYTRSLDVSAGGIVRSVNLMVPEKPDEIGNYVNLRERVSEKKLYLSDEGVVINEKLAKILKISTGDEISLINPDGRPLTTVVTGITENYALNYVYLTPKFYEEHFRTSPSYNQMLLNYSEGADESALSQNLMEIDGVLGVVQTSTISGEFTDMLGSLNAIVWVLIFSAGALAFIVLYNLTNINVNERVRELATIKVLGFFDMEVTSYITRESTITSVLGMLVGLVFGVLLERFVVVTAEVDMVMFAPDISWDCFVMSGLLTLLFTFIVNFALHFKLKKIDMVESLKSVE